MVSVNPRERVPLYSDDVKKAYYQSTSRSSLDPHLYWTCSEIYKTAISRQRDNIIVLNGESGSGKTETFKYAIDFLTKISCKNDQLRTKIFQVKQKKIFLKFKLCYLLFKVFVNN